MADELETRARALLAAYRRDAGPSPAASERLLAAVRRSAAIGAAEVSSQPPASDDGAAVAPVVPLRPYSRHWVGVAVVGLVAAAVVIAVRVSPRRAGADRDESGSAAALQASEDPGQEAVKRAAGRGATTTGRAGSAESHDSAGHGMEAKQSVDAITEAGASTMAIGGKSPARAGDAPRKSGDSGTGRSGDSPGASRDAGELAQELALVRAVHDALATEQAGQALALLDEHTRRFPAGALHEEAAALRAVALCAGGRGREGTEAAAKFLAAYPGSLSAERVRRACEVN